ncbi:unnamed protein product, partial [Ectocarpus fasciculatus]
SPQEVPVKHVVVNKVVDESVKEGYIERLSKGQAAGACNLPHTPLLLPLHHLDPDFLRACVGASRWRFSRLSWPPQVAKGAAGVSLTLVPYFDVEVRNVYGLRFMAQTLFAPRDKA